MTDHRQLLLGFAVDIIAVSILAYGLYFRRHQRRDLTLGFMGINVGLFAVSSFTTGTSISVGFGIGLFALLSVVRLRSQVATQEEIGYYFVALVLGIVNGLAVDGGWGVALMLNAMLIAVVFAADHPRVLAGAERQMVLLDGTYAHDDELVATLERRLGFTVTRSRVEEVDYVRGRTKVDVRYRTDRPLATAPDPPGPGADDP